MLGCVVPAVLLLASACIANEERVHDHTSRHGGVVAMSGSYHVEALVQRDGLLRFWVTDFARAPVSLDGVRARAVVKRPAGAPDEVPLTLRDGALEARTSPLPDQTDAEVRFEATLPDRSDDARELLVDFTLPIAPATASASR